MSHAPLRLLSALLLLAALAACGGTSGGGANGGITGGTNPAIQIDPRPLRIFHNPYRGVDWQQDLRLKGQHHDHVRTDATKIRAYDAAGYHAIAAFDYSGAPQMSVALHSRLWPIDNVLPADLLASLQNIKVWFPSAEEAGLSQTHVTSPFLETYIERWEPSSGTPKQSWQYETREEVHELVRSLGGLPILAHPWGIDERYASLTGLFGVEIYSAYAEARRQQSFADFAAIDRNAVMLENWDRALASNQSIIGFAVNDHFGPIPSLPVTDDIRDSGKIIALAKSATLAGYRDALERGAVLAIRDQGIRKDQYARVDGISVGNTQAHIETQGAVRWISMGREIAVGPVLLYSALSAGSTYVRAEISNSDGSVVYTQAFWVRPVGDADGDNVVTALDGEICAAVSAADESNPDRVAACNE